MSARLSPTGHRYASHLVGACFLLTLAIVVASILQTGRVRQWFNPGQEIRIVLPQEGLFGLASGASVEILGTDAGSVEEIVIEPDQQIHARVRIRQDMKPFVRQDSAAYIRKRFGVAGDAFVEITRGFGKPMDWEFAVIEARVDRAPTETLQSILEELRSKAVPMVEQADRALVAWTKLGERLADPEGDVSEFVENLNSISGRIKRGEGAVGRLLTSEELVEEIDTSFHELKAGITKLQPIIDDLQKTSSNAAKITDSLAERREQLPELLTQLNASLKSIQRVLADVQRVTPQLPGIAKDIGDTTQQLPMTILQVQQTLQELEKLIQQTQQSWLLGGGGGQAPVESNRIAPREAQP
ncbi:MCE family protein [Planctomycetales bacterium ZRK34]|nr:MCE family protein [Planctomycetales bacterium ZRK34]